MHKAIAVYLRLSQEEESIGESGSIASQRQMIQEYIARTPDLSKLPALEFVDDGYSGTNFDRPGVALLLEAVHRGEIGCILVKDFSRFGRQYLQVSRFIDQIFPYLGVRFIAINDRYDSDRHRGAAPDMGVPVRNLINAMYSRDISQKLKSAKRTQMRQGVFSHAFASFGYQKDEEDHHRLLIDQPAAQIVRRIFDLAYEGHSGFQIACALNADGIPTPAAYKAQRGSKLAMSETARMIWTSEIIAKILRDERYTGTFVGGKRENGRLGTGERIHRPKEAWIRVPGAHPAIIPHELFDAVAAKRRGFASPAVPNTHRPLQKKVRCGYCGHALRYIGGGGEPYYVCDTARYTGRYGCLRHRCRESDILGAARAAVWSQMEVMRPESTWEAAQDEESMRCAAAMLSDTLRRAQALKRRLYERYRRGALGGEEYAARRESLDIAIGRTQAQSEALLAGRDKRKGAARAAGQFLKGARMQRQAQDIPGDMLDALVEAVYAYAPDSLQVRLFFRDELERAADAPDMADIFVLAQHQQALQGPPARRGL